MFSDASRIADAINNPKFHPGDRVVLGDGPHKFTSGVFIALNPDVEWAEIRESNGVLNSHPVEWLRPDPEPAKD